MRRSLALASIIAAPILIAYQLAHTSGVVDLLLWLILIWITAHLLLDLKRPWNEEARLRVIGVAMAWLGRGLLAFNYVVLTGGVYPLLGTNNWGYLRLPAIIYAFIMLMGIEIAEYFAFPRRTTQGETIGSALTRLIRSTQTFMVNHGYLVVFIIALLIRLIPEIVAWPWFVGYDTPEYAATLMDYLVKPTFFTYTWWYGGPSILPPLLYMLLYPIAFLVNPWIIFKVVNPVLLALMGVAMLYALKRLGLNGEEALIGAALFTFYPTTYTISWELSRNMLGIIFILLTMAEFERHIHGEKRWAILAVLAVLSTLAHQTSATLTALLFLTYFAVKDHDPRWLLLGLIGVFGDVVYTNFAPLHVAIIHSSTGVSLNVSSPLTESRTTIFTQALSQYLAPLLVAFWPLLLLTSHYKRRPPFSVVAILLWLLIIVLPAALAPSFSFVQWWRWSLMIPMALAPLATRPKLLALSFTVLFLLLDIAWTWAPIMPSLFPSASSLLVQGTFTRACAVIPMEAEGYEAGLYAATHNGTYVTDYCTYTFMHLADRFGRNIVVSYDPQQTAESLNGTVYLVTDQLINATKVTQFGSGVTLLPDAGGTSYPIYIYEVKPSTPSQ
ncbi:MAG: glycosyltransferase family 39 protein [Thermocladium sp.]